MKYPKFLDTNDSIYLVSPSFGCNTEPYKSRLLKSIEHFKEKKFNIIEGKCIYNNQGLLSQSPKDCGKEILDAYKSDAKLLLSVGGGEMMMSILPYISFNEIASLEPKWFMGYSDNTNLSFLLPTLADTAAIYGSCAPEFGSESLIKYQLDQIELIKGAKLYFEGYPMYERQSLKSEDNPYATLNLDTNNIIYTYPEELPIMKGRIIGGCIDVVSTLIGTKYDNIKEFNSKNENVLWFFEACDMNAIEVARRLLQMKYAGWFEKASGFIFGRPYNDSEMFDNTPFDMLITALKDLGVPIIFNVDIGHVKPQIPVIVGSIATVKATDSSYTIEYELK